MKALVVAFFPLGLVELPLADSLCAENPDIRTNQPKGTVSLGISIDPAIPPVRTLDYRLLDSLRREWDEASAEIRLSTGVRKIPADDKGALRIPLEDSWIAANPAIVLSEMPKKIGLAFK
jgi:hypothetical protein